jgi:hypothetical protein
VFRVPRREALPRATGRPARPAAQHAAWEGMIPDPAEEWAYRATEKTGSSWIRSQTAGQLMARSPRAAPVSMHVGRCGAHEAFLETSGTAAGWKRGRGPSAFFRRHLSRLSAPRPTIPASPDARSREPSPRARPGGNAPAFSRGPGFARSRIRFRGARLRCACGRPSAPGWGRGWRDRYLPENADGPLPRFHPSAVPDASTHAWSNPRLPTCPDTIPLHRRSSRPCRA